VEETPAQVVQRLLDATNQHDVDRLVNCFAEDYVNETPVHPARGFTGREQVRRNWTQIFSAIPDVTAETTRVVEQDDAVWSEWEMRGTRADGMPHLMRGVIIFRIRAGEVAAARFYLEPVDDSGGDVGRAVRTLTGVT
jgi:ketosteroid isomerase-like protein